MRRGDLFVLSWESLRRVEWGKVSSFLSMSGGGLFNSLLMGLLLGGLLPNRCRPLRGWKTRPEKERRGRSNRHHSIPAP